MLLLVLVTSGLSDECGLGESVLMMGVKTGRAAARDVLLQVGVNG